MVLSISNDYLSDFHVAREANRAVVTAEKKVVRRIPMPLHSCSNP